MGRGRCPPAPLPEGCIALWTPILTNGLWPLRSQLRACGAVLRLARRHGARQARRACGGHGAGSSTLFIGRAATRSCGARGPLPPWTPFAVMVGLYGRFCPCHSMDHRYGTPAICRPRSMAGGASVTSAGLRRRSPPPSIKAENAPLTRSRATAGEPRPSATTKRGEAPFPSGEGVTAVAVTDRESLACSASRRTCCAE